MLTKDRMNAIQRLMIDFDTPTEKQRFASGISRTRRVRLLLSTALMLLLPHVLPADVFVEYVEVKENANFYTGNIVYMDSDGKKTVLTTSRRDFDPVLSPDGKSVAFARTYRPPEDDSGPGWTNCSIWIVEIKGTNPPRCLVTGRDSDDYKERLTDLANPQFSPDGKQLYFTSCTWGAESAIHVVDLSTGKRKYVISGNLKKIIPRGEYVNYLLVQRHLYFYSGGSYDWVWLVSPAGKVIGPVTSGEGSTSGTIEDFWDLYVKDKKNK